MKSVLGVFAVSAVMTLSADLPIYSDTLSCAEHYNSYGYFSQSGYANSSGIGMDLPCVGMNNAVPARKDLMLEYTEAARQLLKDDSKMSACINMIRDRLGNFFDYGKVLVDQDKISDNVSVYVVADRDVEDMMKDLDAFDYGWWLDARGDFPDNIIVDVMPV